MNNYTRICARVDLDAIEYNMEMMKKNSLNLPCTTVSIVITSPAQPRSVSRMNCNVPKTRLW